MPSYQESHLVQESHLGYSFYQKVSSRALESNIYQPGKGLVMEHQLLNYNHFFKNASLRLCPLAEKFTRLIRHLVRPGWKGLKEIGLKSTNLILDP